jgi:hypothetical protein
MKRHNKGISSSSPVDRLLWLGRCIGALGWQHVLVDVVRRLQVEEARAHMATHVGLVAVVAQPLSTSFELLSRRETAERARWVGVARDGLARRAVGCRGSGRGTWLARPWRRTSAARRWRQRRGCRPPLKGSGQVDSRLEVLWFAQLDVDPDVIREATHEQFCFLGGRQVARVAEDRIEAIRVVLDRGQEGKPGELR